MSLKKLTFYRTDTGEITGTSAFHDIYHIAIPDGEACIAGEIDGEKFYIVDGEPVEYPPRPHTFAEFDFAARRWVDHRTIDQIRDEAKAKVIAWASATLSQFTAGYPSEEVLSWSAKLPAARRVMEGGREPMIEIEAQVLGVSPLDLAAKVVERGSKYEGIVAMAAAIRSQTHAAIDAAPDAGSVDATLAAALARATATLKALGVE